MDILYLLIPLSVVLVLAILAVFGWALHAASSTTWSARLTYPDDDAAAA